MNKQILRPIFFIGVPRSGTTIIYEQFSQHESLGWISNYQNRIPKFLSVSLFNRLFDNSFIHKIGRRPDSSKTNNLILTYPKATEPYIFWDLYTGKNFSMNFLLDQSAEEDVKKRIRKKHISILQKTGKNRFCTKFTGPSRIQYIQSIFPDAIFIHIVRDGRAVVRSLLNVDFWKDGGGLEKKWWLNGKDDKLFQAFPEWKNKAHILAALQWRNIIEKTKEESSSHLSKDQYLEIKYEDFIVDPKNIIQRIFSFCDLDINSRVLQDVLAKQNISDKNKKYLEFFSPTELEELNEVLSPTLQMLSYE